MDLTEIKSLLEQQGGAVKAAMEKYQGQLDTLGKVHQETKDEVKHLSEDFAKLQSNFQAMGQEIAHGVKSAQPQRQQTMGEVLVKSDKFKQFIEAKGEIAKVRIELPQALTHSIKGTTTLGVVNETILSQQMPGVVPGGFVPVLVRNQLRSIPVSTSSVVMLREASWTNSAAEASEGSAKKDSDITFEDYEVPVRTIAHFHKVSNQLLADAPAIAAYIETRLRDGLAQRIEKQIISGDGTSPNISGLTDSGNFTAYTSTSTDTLTDAINRAKYTMWAAGYMADMVIVNPADWGAMEREREGAGTGQYLYGMPGVAAGMNPFGVRVVLSTYVSAGYFIIGAFNSFVTVLERQGAVIEMGYSNDDFTKNLVTLRAEERLGLAIERPAAVYYGQFAA